MTSRPTTAAGSPGNHAPTLIQKRQLSSIPARIRAFVKVIHDLDRDQFPEVFNSVSSSSGVAGLSSNDDSSSLVVVGASDSPTTSSAAGAGGGGASSSSGVVQLNETAVHALSVEIGREIKTQQDWADFATALEDYSRHLSSVDIACLERSGLGRLVAMSSSIDYESSGANLSMSRDLTAVYACHQLILKIVQTDYIANTTHPLIFERFMIKMAQLLQDLEETVIGIARRRESMRRSTTGQRSSVGASRGGVQLGTADTTSATPHHPSDSSGIHVLEEEKEAAYRIVELNSTLEYHVGHLSWFMSVSTAATARSGQGQQEGTSRGGEKRGETLEEGSVGGRASQQHNVFNNKGGTHVFDARDFINDVSAAEIWCHHVGRYNPACSVEAFMPALASFPEWAHEPILKVIDFRSCGIVSARGMLRILSLWGPFLLLDRNLTRDLSRGFINLSCTTEMAEARLRQQIAEKPPPPPADAWTTPSSANETAKKPQRFGLPAGTCVMTLSTEKNCAFDVLLVTSKGNIKHLVIDRDGGTWMMPGVSQEDYECPTDACISFPHIFAHPAGDGFYVNKMPEDSTREAATSDAFSILHRACFRNNVPYVMKLLDRGNGVIVNSAVVDPSITSALSWTPLLAAVNNPNGDPFLICKMLLEYGADATYSDASTCTALYYAIVNRYVKAARVLIDHFVTAQQQSGRRQDGGQLLATSWMPTTTSTVSAAMSTSSEQFSSRDGTSSKNGHRFSSEIFLPVGANHAAPESAWPQSNMCRGNVQRIPPPTTSAVTIPLFVGLGAHFYNVSDLDNLRLEHSLPDLEIVQMLLGVTSDLRVCRAAYEVLFHKLEKKPMGHRKRKAHEEGNRSPEGERGGGSDSEVPWWHAYGTVQTREWTRTHGGDVTWGNKNSSDLGEGKGSEWNFGNFPCPTLTDDEIAREVKAVANHTLLCQANEVACRKVLKAIGDHCFLLSARRLVSQARDSIEPHN